MTASEYIAAFASIILALAVADLATSMHRLLRSRSHVKWDWLPLAAAFLILMGTLQFWWTFFDVWRSATEFKLGRFLPDFCTLMLLFFVASAALPDQVPTEGLDLQSYYLENRTYFWTLFVLMTVSSTIGTVLHKIQPGTSFADIAKSVLETGNLALVAIAAILIATARRWVHVVLMLFVVTALVWQWVSLTIAG